MKSNKFKNQQVFTNKQNNININAQWDVNAWIINNQQIVDSSWYTISKKDTTILEIVSKYIIWKLWEKWWLFASIASVIIWAVTSLFWWYKYLTTSKPSILVHANWILSSWKIFDQINLIWVISMFWFLLFILWFYAIHALKHKSDSQCPKCKQPYALTEVWDPKEKEIKTSRDYMIDRIRYYKCTKCKFEEERKTHYTKPLK